MRGYGVSRAASRSRDAEPAAELIADTLAAEQETHPLIRAGAELREQMRGKPPTWQSDLIHLGDDRIPARFYDEAAQLLSKSTVGEWEIYAMAQALWRGRG